MPIGQQAARVRPHRPATTEAGSSHHQGTDRSRHVGAEGADGVAKVGQNPYLEEKKNIMNLSLPDQQLKNLIKAALIEVLTERQDILAEAMREALEDYALGQAIDEGRENKPVAREEVFKLFDQAN